MKQFSSLIILVLMVSLMPLMAQEIKGEKVGIVLNNEAEAKIYNAPDVEKPEIILLSPMFEDDYYYKSDESEVEIVGKASDNNKVILVTANSRICDLDEQGVFRTSVELLPGQNRFKIRAIDGSNNIKDHFILLNYTPPVLSLRERIEKNAVYYGLLIGINRYKDPGFNDLKEPINDCRNLYKILHENYFFKEENLILLENATRSEMIRTLGQLAEKITPEDNLLIFFAGHGTMDEKSENGYWLPSNADRNDKSDWVRNSTILDILQEINSRHTLVIADACFSGAILTNRSPNRAEEFAYKQYYDLPSRKAMTSGTNTVVPDRSPFAKYLLEHLEKNTQTFLTSQELFNSFNLAVINNSKALPQFGNIEDVGDQGGDFIFFRPE
jgi:hypothetical protein